MSRFLKVVKDAFATYPLVTNAVIYGTLFVGAEYSQQVVTKKLMLEHPQPLDVGTISRYAIYGTTMQGPILYFWYKWLDGRFIGTSVRTVARKLVFDQFVCTPPLLVLFFVAMSVMERKKDLFEECQRKFVPTFKTSCCFWLPIQTINFFVIPATYRVTYVGICAFAWVNILCWIKRQQYEK